MLIAQLDADHSLHARATQWFGEHARAGSLHAFWPNDVSLLDIQVADSARIHGPRQITDVYLIALAVRHGGRFVTLDAAVARDAVIGSAKRHVLVL